MSIKLNSTEIKYSWTDKRKEINIPKTLTPRLAEIIGIHIGDGSLHLTGKNRKSPQFQYSCHIEEKNYCERFVIPLLKKLFNIKKIRRRRYGNEYRIIFYSLALTNFYSTIFGIPVGKKSRIIDVPKIITNSNNVKIITACLRGIVDTDFFLYFVKRQKNNSLYPVLRGTFASKKLVKTLKMLFERFGINCCRYSENRYDKRTKKTYPKHIVQISGKKNLEKFIDKIGFHNEKHINKLSLIIGPEGI